RSSPSPFPTRRSSDLPSLLPGRVLVSFGPPLAAGAGATEVRQAVMELSCDYFQFRKEQGRSLARSFVASARRHWRRPAIADTSGDRKSTRLNSSHVKI